VGFLVAGQGGAHAGMAAGLAAAFPAFRAVLERCDAVMGLDRPLAALCADAAALRRTEVAQPALFALAAGLGAVWRGLGVEPAALLGHSLGEYAAAHLAGVLPLEDAARLVAARGRLMAALPPGGAMAALLGPEDAARALLAGRHPELELAALNGPAALTVAGPEAAIGRLLGDGAALAAAGLSAERLGGVGLAFHSRLLEPALDGLEAAAGRVEHRPPRLPVVGNLTGEVVRAYDAAYWRAQARAPVRFAAGLATLARLGCTHLVELGPRPMLCGLARGAAPGFAAALPSLAGPDAGRNRAALLGAAAALWGAGGDVEWAAVLGPRRPGDPDDLPSYPFQRQRYWFSAGANTPGHPLLGERLDIATGEAVFRAKLDTGRLGFLADHVVFEKLLVPGASHVVTMLAGAGGGVLTELAFAAPLTLPAAGCNTQLLLRGGRAELHADAGGPWTLHAEAAVGSAAAAAAAAPPVDRDAILARCRKDAEGPAGLHAMLAERGIALGPSFRGIQQLWRGEGEALAEVALPEGVPPIAPIHPALLDACFQTLGATFSGGGTGGAFLPLGIDRVALHRAGATRLCAHARARSGNGSSADVAVGDLILFGETGDRIATIEGLTLKRVASAEAAPNPADRWSYAVEWTEVPTKESTALPPPPALAALATAARDRAAAAMEDSPGLAAGLEALAGAYAAAALAATDPATVAPAAQRLFLHLPDLAAGQAAAPEELVRRLVARHGERLEITLACRSGRLLPAVLQGRANPLAALFGEEGDGAIYAEPPFARMLNEMVVATVLGAAEAVPPGHRLRVLEIGAGTGAVLAHLRDAVGPARLDYTFTDISPAFVARATERFGPETARYATLDIERDPVAQAFAPGDYDLVLAANVLHATTDLRQALRHAAALLAPQGVMLLLEAVRRSNWSDLVFGLTPGWWRFADAPLRPDHPLLPAARWRELLAERFAETTLVASPGAGDQMLAVARGPRPVQPAILWEAPAGTAPLALAAAGLRQAQAALAGQGGRLCLVTRGAQPATAEGERPPAVEPAQAVLLGLGRVLALEHPELDCRLLDLGPGAPPDAAAHPPPGVREAAWRDGRWLAPQLVRIGLPTEPPFRTTGTHLVTGGLGGLGRLLADWLLAHGAERVCLMGRQPPEEAVAAGIDVVLGDVSAEADLRRVIAGIDAAGPPLRGVFHLAGSLSDGAVANLSSADFARVFAAKVDGAVALDAVLGVRALDAFVLFGSSAGLIGNPGQATHAAANAFLDALAWARQARGLPGLCIDWGAWGEAGTLTRSAVGARLVAAGAGLMPPPVALEALGRAIVSRRAQVMIAAIDWPRFLAGYVPGEMPAFFGRVAPVPVAPAAAPRPPAAAGPDGADARRSREALAAFVASEAAKVLPVGTGTELPGDLPLNDAGLDSLMALNLRKALASGLGLQLPATLVFNFPTLDRLTDHLAGLVGLAAPSAPSAAPAAPPPPQADDAAEAVRTMTEAEMVALIAREFSLTGTGDA
jgi:acyl transferase domain-containing protein/acyl carrier protein